MPPINGDFKIIFKGKSIPGFAVDINTDTSIQLDGVFTHIDLLNGKDDSSNLIECKDDEEV